MFSEINLDSGLPGRSYEERNQKLCRIIYRIAKDFNQYSPDLDNLGDAYEYLIGYFATGSYKKLGNFTPTRVFPILSLELSSFMVRISVREKE